MGLVSCCFIMSVILFGGHIPIAVGMLDGSNDEAGFHGEEAQPRRRYYDDFTVATVTYAKDGRAMDRHACCILFFIHHGAFSVSIVNPSVPLKDSQSMNDPAEQARRMRL